MQNDYFSVPTDIFQDILRQPENYLRFYTYDGRQCAQHIDKSEKSYSLKIDKSIQSKIIADLVLVGGNNKPLQGNYFGGSTRDFVLPHLKMTYLLKFDLEKCFNSITYEQFEKSANNKVEDLNIIKALYFKPNLVVGLSASSLLAHVVLSRVIDSYINKLIHGSKFSNKAISYTRFYDDIFLSSDDYEALAEIKRLVSKHLESNGFSVNLKKTSLGKMENATILKNRINNHKIYVGKRFKNNLRLIMHYYSPDSSDLASTDRTISQLRIILGKIAHILRTETTPAKKWFELERHYSLELDRFKDIRNDILSGGINDVFFELQ